MKLLNDELDAKRKAERSRVEKIENKSESKPLLSAIKKSQYSSLKNQEDLNDEPSKKLEKVKEVLTELGEMHQLKERFRNIFEPSNSEIIGLLNLADWLKDAATKFPSSCQTVIRWLGEIIPYFKNRTTQGIVEGINNKLKLIKPKGFGLRNFDNFSLRSLLIFHF